MAEKQHELLDQSDFDQDVACADGEKVEQKRKHRLPARQPRAQQHGRQSQNNNCRQHADAEQLKQQWDRAVHFIIGAVSRGARDL